ncbi:DUF6477 family protein [Nereida sp. MMG025]|uniref:DUF6477 family protein n=1 Tax=Nereida sp. MMG025 TaxID=2909981 RepID=UPI001F2E8C73|nr:DUF6477 family protein [Nereida sp. MMG025]MCF6443259.1 DUF6477 family protein [Nereida sp. MMG025]
MTDLLSLLATLRRPRLLMQTARVGLHDYRREAHLQRVLKGTAPAQHGAALAKLIDVESRLNDKRRKGDANYSTLHHVDVMIALLAEADALQKRRAALNDTPEYPANEVSAYIKASGSDAFLSAT